MPLLKHAFLKYADSFSMRQELYLAISWYKSFIMLLPILHSHFLRFSSFK